MNLKVNSDIALAVKFQLKFVNIKIVNKILNFDISSMPIIEFELNYLIQIFFFHCATEQDNFSHNQSKDVKEKQNSPPLKFLMDRT